MSIVNITYPGSKNMSKEPKLNALEILKLIMIRYGLSPSEAIRKYTNMFGLPVMKEDQAHLDSIKAE